MVKGIEEEMEEEADIKKRRAITAKKRQKWGSKNERM
jgi:hypothetical protein